MGLIAAAAVGLAMSSVSAEECPWRWSEMVEVDIAGTGDWHVAGIDEVEPDCQVKVYILDDDNQSDDPPKYIVSGSQIRELELDDGQIRALGPSDDE